MSEYILKTDDGTIAISSGDEANEIWVDILPMDGSKEDGDGVCVAFSVAEAQFIVDILHRAIEDRYTMKYAEQGEKGCMPLMGSLGGGQRCVDAVGGPYRAGGLGRVNVP